MRPLCAAKIAASRVHKTSVILMLQANLKALSQSLSPNFKVILNSILNPLLATGICPCSIYLILEVRGVVVGPIRFAHAPNVQS